MRRNLKPIERTTRAERMSTPRAARTSSNDILEPVADPEALWEEDESNDQSCTNGEDRDEDAAAEEESPSAAGDKDNDEITGPDDALGLYLRQMGAIPLLS